MVKGEAEITPIINKAAELLSKKISVRTLILFGSQLSGQADEHSDIDLAVVSPDFEGMNYEQIVNVFVGLARECDSRLELHPYTVRDLDEARPTNFLGHLLATGKVVFGDPKLTANNDK